MFLSKNPMYRPCKRANTIYSEKCGVGEMKSFLSKEKREFIVLVMGLAGIMASAVLNLASVYNTTPFALLDPSLIGLFCVRPAAKKAIKELKTKRFEEGFFTITASLTCMVFAFVCAFLPIFRGKINIFVLLSVIPVFSFALQSFIVKSRVFLLSEKAENVLKENGKTLSVHSESKETMSGNGETVKTILSLKKTFWPLFPLAVFLFLFISLGSGNFESGIYRSAAFFAAVPAILVFFPKKVFLTYQLSAAQKGILLFDGAMEKAEKVNMSVFSIGSSLAEGNLRVERVYTKNTAEKDVLLFASSFYGENDAISQALKHGNKEPLLIADEAFPYDGTVFSAGYNGKKYMITRSYNLEKLGLNCEYWLETLPKTKTLLAVIEDESVLGFVALSDTINPTAKPAVDSLNKTTETVLLTQESKYLAKTLAKQLGIGSHVGELSANEINEELEKLTYEGGFIMYTGVLPVPESGLSVKVRGGGEDYDAEILSNDLTLLPEILQYSKRKLLKIKALSAVCVGLAAVLSALCIAGFVPPLLAALLGSVSAVALKLF